MSVSLLTKAHALDGRYAFRFVPSAQYRDGAGDEQLSIGHAP